MGGFGGCGGGAAHSSGDGGLNGGKGAKIDSFNAEKGWNIIYSSLPENSGLRLLNNPDLPHGCVKITIMKQLHQYHHHLCSFTTR